MNAGILKLLKRTHFLFRKISLLLVVSVCLVVLSYLSYVAVGQLLWNWCDYNALQLEVVVPS